MKEESEEKRESVSEPSFRGGTVLEAAHHVLESKERRKRGLVDRYVFELDLEGEWWNARCRWDPIRAEKGMSCDQLERSGQVQLHWLRPEVA